jgi:hypothetical protein
MPPAPAASTKLCELIVGARFVLRSARQILRRLPLRGKSVARPRRASRWRHRVQATVQATIDATTIGSCAIKPCDPPAH